MVMLIPVTIVRVAVAVLVVSACAVAVIATAGAIVDMCELLRRHMRVACAGAMSGKRRVSRTQADCHDIPAPGPVTGGPGG